MFIASVPSHKLRVNSTQPFITVVIPARPGQLEILAVNAALELIYPHSQLEILVARGRQPAAQRNVAMRDARGELIYFLDDDAVPDVENLIRAVAIFEDPKVVMLGGPNLCPPRAPFIEKLFAVVLGSWLAFGPSRARYKRVGEVRQTSEKELILCNLIARRAPVIALGGFDEALYPNEENALMDSVQKAGGKLVYDPQFIAYRRPRSNLKAFGKMLLTYGRGRAEQFRLHPSFGSVLNFVPPLFCLYVVLLAMIGGLVIFDQLPAQALWFGGPMIVYGAVVVLHTLSLVPCHGIVLSLIASPLLVASHLLYGAGFWYGLITKVEKAGRVNANDLTIESIPV